MARGTQWPRLRLLPVIDTFVKKPARFPFTNNPHEALSDSGSKVWVVDDDGGTAQTHVEGADALDGLSGSSQSGDIPVAARQDTENQTRASENGPSRKRKRCWLSTTSERKARLGKDC